MPEEKTGVGIVRELIRLGYPKYRLAKRLGVTRNAVLDMALGKYFDENKHLSHIQAIRLEFFQERGLDPFKRY